MSFRNKLQYFLVRKLRISNKEVQTLLLNKKIWVNGNQTGSNVKIEPEDEIIYQNVILQNSKVFTTIAFYKPRGIETTLNKKINDNLASILPFDDVFPIGRLDKDSEGLLLLSNDGRIYDRILRNENKTEKEYVVKVNRPFDNEFLDKMVNGIEIMGKTTLPCMINRVDNVTFKIILTQGLNRQIRRMCHKLGYEVTFLLRKRIGNLNIENLKPLEWRLIDKHEIFEKRIIFD